MQVKKSIRHKEENEAYYNEKEQPGTQGRDEKENQKLWEGSEEERRKNARGGKEKLRAHVKMASLSGVPISTWYVVFQKEHGRSPSHPLKSSVACGNLLHP